MTAGNSAASTEARATPGAIESACAASRRVCPIETPLADAVRQHQQIAVGVLDKDLPLTGFAIAGPAPDLARAEVDRPVSGSEPGQDRGGITEVELKHRALPERRLHRPGLEPTMPLAQHDLLAFGMLQIGEVFRVAPEGDAEADDVRPERQAGSEVGDMQLGDHVGPAGFWR